MLIEFPKYTDAQVLGGGMVSFLTEDVSSIEDSLQELNQPACIVKFKDGNRRYLAATATYVANMIREAK